MALVNADVMSVAEEIMSFLRLAVIDEGTGFDTGGGMGQRDVWFKVDGREYFMTLRPSNAQILKDTAA
jgi:hypothetical protein